MTRLVTTGPLIASQLGTPTTQRKGFFSEFGGPQARIAGAGISGITAMFSAFAKAKAIRSLRKFEGQQLLFNARMLDFQQKDAIKRGDVAAGRVSKRALKLLGAQRAALAAQGFELGEADAAAIQRETLEVGAEDARTIRNNAFREAFGFKVNAVGLRAQARISRIESKLKERTTIATGLTRTGASLFQAGASGAGR